MADNTAPLELPIGVTESQVLKQIARIESQLRKTQADVEKKFIASNKRVADSYSGISRGAKGMQRSTTASLQNVGYQAQDIIVQIQSGQGAARAFSQQLPQMLMGFGLAGVAIGTAIPLLIGVGSAMMKAGASAEEAEKQIKALATAIDALEAAQKRASTSGEDLIAQFGPMASQARALYEVQQKLAELNLTRELGRATALISGQVQGLGDGTAAQFEAMGEAADEYLQRIDRLGTSAGRGLDALSKRIGVSFAPLMKLSDLFGVSYTEAGKLAGAMANLRDAEGPDQVASAAAALREQLSGALANMDGTNEEAIKLVEQLLKSEDAALRAAAVNLAGNISAGADEASRLASNLNAAADALSRLASAGASADIARIGAEAKLAALQGGASSSEADIAARMAQERANLADALGSSEGAIRAAAQQNLAALRADLEATAEANALIESIMSGRKASGGRGGGRSSAFENELQQLQQGNVTLEEQIALYERVRASGGNWETQLAALEIRQRLLNAAQKEGIELSPQAIDSIGQMADAYAEAEQRLADMQKASQAGEDALFNLFGSILDGADSAKQALADLLMQIAKVQFAEGLLGLLNLTPGGSDFISMIGGLTTRGFADGGPTRPGGKFQPDGIVHRGELVWSQEDIRRVGGIGVADAIRRGARGYATGGVVGLPSVPRLPSAVAPASAVQVVYVPQPYIASVAADDGGTIFARMQSVATRASVNTVSQYDRALPTRVQSINQNPRKR